MHVWDKNAQKAQRRNNQNKGSLSQNVMKEYAFTLQVERDVVEDDLPVILTPQLTL